VTGTIGEFTGFCSELVLDNGEQMLLEGFQREILADHFAGATELLVLLPKKNGKTTLLAALALFHLLSVDDCECVIAAASRDQATILYDQAVGFVRRTPQLERHVLVQRGYRQIGSRHDSGRVRVLAADVDTADGVIPTLALVDELHRHRSAALYGIFRDGLGPRGGQLVTISTAGDSETSPLGVMRADARRLADIATHDRHVRAASADGAYVMHEWALAEGDDVDDMQVVKLANPAPWQTLAALARRHDSPSMLSAQWARFACGIWMAGEAWWLAAEAWRAGEVAETLAPGDRITLGFDGSRRFDATALVACRLEDGLIEPLAVWEAPATGGEEWEVPAGEVDAALARAFETYDVVRGYFDPPLWQSQIDAWARDFGEHLVVRYPTNRGRMMSAVERFRTDVAAATLTHTGDEVLTRHVLNAQVREVRGGYWLTKERASSPNRIDAAVAAVLAYEARCDAVAAGALRPRSKVLMSW
jgi:phage terminase large subunit-like protein